MHDCVQQGELPQVGCKIAVTQTGCYTQLPEYTLHSTPSENSNASYTNDCKQPPVAKLKTVLLTAGALWENEKNGLLIRVLLSLNNWSF